MCIYFLFTYIFVSTQTCGFRLVFGYVLMNYVFVYKSKIKIDFQFICKTFLLVYQYLIGQ